MAGLAGHSWAALVTLHLTFGLEPYKLLRYAPSISQECITNEAFCACKFADTAWVDAEGTMMIAMHTIFFLHE